MAGHQGRQLASKWAKTEALLSNSTIAPHIPPTRRFTADNLRSMLNTHRMVVIKPVVGSGGQGVIKVTGGKHGYSFTVGSDTLRYPSFEEMMRALVKRKRNRDYLIQKGISLARVGSRPIDYRVKYVKKGTGWTYRALVGRIARQGLFVTNLSRGGTLVTASQGISRSLGSGYVKSMKRKMRHITEISTRVLEQRFPGIAQLGFDYGIDKQGRIWIFEVNTRPH